MRIPGLKALRLHARWIRSQFADSALILGYHRVVDTPTDPYSLNVSPRNFADQLEFLSQHACPLSLSTLVRGLRNGSLPQRAVAITFDDGYADNLCNAKPLLELHEIPATVFVVTGNFGGEFWWDELERLLLDPSVLPERFSLTHNGGGIEWILDDDSHLVHDKDTPSPRQSLLMSLYERLLPLSSTEQQTLLTQIRNWAGAPNGRPRHRTLTADELLELISGDLVDVGSHTHTHPILTKLSVEAQIVEMERSKVHLEQVVGRPVSSFSYPNGSASKDTWNLVQQAGYEYACCSFNDTVWRRSNPYLLPRFWPGDWGGDELASQLSKWL